MGWKENLKKANEERARRARESRTYSDIVKQRTLQARRQAYEKQAIIEARLQGERIAKARANKQTFGQAMTSFAANIAKKATATPAKKSPVKRKVHRKVKYRRVPVRRRVTYRRVPVRRVRRRARYVYR